MNPGSLDTASRVCYPHTPSCDALTHLAGNPHVLFPNYFTFGKVSTDCTFRRTLNYAGPAVCRHQFSSVPLEGDRPPLHFEDMEAATPAPASTPVDLILGNRARGSVLPRAVPPFIPASPLPPVSFPSAYARSRCHGRVPDRCLPLIRPSVGRH